MDEDKQRPDGEEGRMIPTWVYVTLLLFLVFILLGVESVLNWIFSSR